MLIQIASFELTDLPLIRHVAKKGPIIISTGLASLHEIGTAVDAAHTEDQIILLHCVSSYPAPISQSNVRTWNIYPIHSVLYLAYLIIPYLMQQRLHLLRLEGR